MLIIDEKIIALDELADELVKAFVKLEVVTAFRERKSAFESDEALQEKLQTLEANRDFMDFRPEIRDLQRSLVMNETVYQLRLAENDVQASLSDLAKKIAGVVSDDIFVDENLPLKKGAHHGRHH
jgi:cell fate (sporulation/competence/biofilm development) regulator YlbF (YheA/YmcA/DUF963 family)